MPSIPHILKMRHRRWIKANRNPSQRLGLGFAVLFTLAFATFLILIPIGYSIIIQDLPSLEILPTLIEPPNGLLLHPTIILDRSGENILQTVQNPAIDDRRYLPISLSTVSEADEYISPDLVDATIAIVDPAFWDSPGFSIGDLSDGKATPIAQRLVRSLLLKDEEPGLKNMIRERILAWQIISKFSHNKVLEWYLNTQYYGNLAYGADTAAQVYFGKPASALTLAEAAVLTAVGEAPTLNPIDAPDEALKRQKIFLEAMVAQGYITTKEADKAADAQIMFSTPIIEPAISFKDYLNLVWDQLAPFYDLEQIERGGYRIITSLDFDLQQQANCTRQALITRLKNPDAVQPDPENCPAARLLPTISVDSEQLPQNISATLVILDPSTGQILAMVGDSDRGLDPAHLPGRPPGSMLTPFLYLTAFTRGFSPASLLWDIPIEIPDFSLSGSESYQGPVRLRSAMANDYLNPAVQTMVQIGADNVWLTLQKMGLTSFARFAGDSTPANCRGCQLLFDSGEVTLLEISHAYSIFANQGLMIGQKLKFSDESSLPPLYPVSILEITDTNGQELFTEPEIERRPVITQQLAFLVTDILSDEAARWPSLGHPNLLEIGRPVAAKVGGTTDLQDTWTIGFTPESIVGVWAGNADLDSQDQGEVPSKISAALWHALTQYATQNIPPADWELPPGISKVDVCDPSGQLPTRHCPTVVNEIFINGNEPAQFDSLYQSFQINRETGLLATVFTPPELVEERVYMLVPPIANQWSEEADIPIPPESYDVISMPSVIENAQIVQPQMFENVSGEINFIGTASGGDFISYRLQAGQGLNPQEWIQISNDLTTPVENGTLTTWDTREFNGLIAIQLIVLRENRKVDSTTIQITVDNQSPDVSIPYPENDQEFQSDRGEYITLQANASDNIGLDTVIFQVDDHELIRHSQPPYAVPWRVTMGEHIFNVKAVDMAGNVSEASVKFVVND